jgi:putative FmdB family regulatory protein
MPKYTFECQNCNLRFDRTLKMGEHPTSKCPSCKEEAPRLFTSFGFGFKKSETSAPANTGVHDLDYPSADKIVGRSAESRWDTYRARDEAKKTVRKEGKSQALVRVDGEGFTEYSSMGSQETKAREKLVDYAVEVERNAIVENPQ